MPRERAVHRVTDKVFKRARGGAVIYGLCGYEAKSITTDTKRVTCKRCLYILR